MKGATAIYSIPYAAMESTPNDTAGASSTVHRMRPLVHTTSQYGRIGPSPLNAVRQASPGPSASGDQSEEALCHWRPSASKVFEGLLVETIGEAGQGGFAYPTVQRYVRRCGQITHQVGCIMDGIEDEDDGYSSSGSDELRDDDKGPELEKGNKHRWHSTQGDDGWASPSEDTEGTADLEYQFRRRIRDHVSHSNVDRSTARAVAAVGVGGQSLIRSRCPPAFVRAPLYFSELLTLGRLMHVIHRMGHTGSATAADRGRVQATEYCLTLVRMCCGNGSGGLEKAEPAEWTTGGRQMDEDAATLQRSQLLVDFRLPEKLAPCLHDRRSEVRRDAANCALSALKGGYERLRWFSPAFEDKVGVDPRALLALGFCTPVWVSGLMGILVGHEGAPLGSATPSRAARQGKENLRRIALSCLGCMAAAGDLATESWQAVRVVPALQGALSRATFGVGTTPISTPKGGTDDTMVGATRDLNGWREGIVDVIRSLVENGSGTTHDMLRNYPGVVAFCKIPETNFPGSMTSKDVAARAAELLQGGTSDEIISLVRRVKSVLATAVRLGDYRVLGFGSDGVPEDVGVTMSLVWGWMQRVSVQLARDSPEHPSTKARMTIGRECIELMHFLLASKSPPALRLVQCGIHPTLATEVLWASSSVSNPANMTHHSDDDRQRTKVDVAKVELAQAKTGLDVLVRLLSVQQPGPLDLLRAHPIRSLVVDATDALADAVAYADRSTLDCLDRSGLGLRLALAVENAAKFARESSRRGVEFVHLVWTYPAGRQARTKLLDRVLWRGHRGLVEQIVISGLIELIVSNMLPDCTTTDISNARLPATFVRYNGTPLLRNEGIALLERVVARRRRCPAVATETSRQIVRHELPSVEMAHLREHRNRPIRTGVGVALRALARLGSTPVDMALSRAGVPRRAVVETRKDPMNSKTKKRWTRWLRRGAELSTAGPEALYLQPAVFARLPKPSLLPTSAMGEPIDREVSSSPEGEGVKNVTDDIPCSSPMPRTPPEEPNSTGLRFEDDPAKTNSHLMNTLTRNIKTFCAPSTPHRPELRQAWAPVTNSESVEVSTERTIRAMVSVEGCISQRSVADLTLVLAAELGVTTASLGTIEVAVEPPIGSPASMMDEFYDGTQPTVNGSTMKMLLAEHLAERLYTRCLTGVLRLPGLLRVEVMTV